MRRAAIVLTTSALTAAGLAVLAPPASAAEIVPRDLTITVTHVGPEDRTCRIDADLYVPAGATAPLTWPLEVVGSPPLTVRLDSPAALTQGTGPAGQLVVFAKLYDIGPDGAVELPHRLISPARVGDVTRPVTIELPGAVQQLTLPVTS